VDLREQLHELGWKKAVIKPRISATAHRTKLIAAEDADAAQNLFDELRDGVGVMAQAFMDSIVTEGEWSLIFFGGEFSHAVLKTPEQAISGCRMISAVRLALRALRAACWRARPAPCIR